jgi:hypothetical protein
LSSAERLLLDEMFAPMLAEWLCAEEFDVVAVAGHPTLAAASDEEVMRWATAHGRRFVTENVKDFQPLVARANERGEPVARMLYTSSRRFPRTRRIQTRCWTHYVTGSNSLSGTADRSTG